ncbi:MAG: membrane protein insertase YidC [Phycisphaerae bacterium]
METRNLIVALLVATGAFFLYMSVVSKLSGNRANNQPVVDDGALPAELAAPADVTPGPTSGPSDRPQDRDNATSAPAASIQGALSFAEATDNGPIVLGTTEGGGTPLRVTLSPLGAAVARIDLSERKANGKFLHQQGAKIDEPYTIVDYVSSPDGTTASFETHRIWIAEYENGNWRLDDLVWGVAEQSSESATFETTLRDGAGEDLVHLTKKYELDPKHPLIRLTVGVENRADRPLTVTFAQDGPVGIARENDYYDMRKIVVARHEEDTIAITARSRGELKDAPTILGQDAQFAWTTSINKYFGVFMRTLPAEGSGSLFTDSIKIVKGELLHGANGVVDSSSAVDPGAPNRRKAERVGDYGPALTDHTADTVIRHYTKSVKLEPDARWAPRFEIYAGARDNDLLKRLGNDYVNKSRLGYELTHSLDSRCFCTFESLTIFMTWLLRTIYAVVGNYGVAIIILVIIVRSLLHPLAVFQQKSMYRMQENMARIQPKMAAIKEKYGNDKVKQNQEMMRLMAEENVNPAGQMVAFLPMLLQMPILIALWTALNTDVALRLAPFDGYWIKDLSRPDAFITFKGDGLTIPLLSSLPVIGSWFTNIASLNLLPILMGISMYLQQKYMPKPHLKAKLEEAKKNPQKAAGPGGMTVEDQIKQQQMIANLMSIMLPIMFYRFPSGLALYWLATNVFGIFESLRIRKQLDREAERRKLAGPEAKPAPRKPGPISRMLKRMAEQAEELQRQADKIADQKPQKKPRSK